MYGPNSLDLTNEIMKRFLDIPLDTDFSTEFSKMRRRIPRNLWGQAETAHPGLNTLVEILRDLTQLVDAHGHTRLEVAAVVHNLRAAFLVGKTIVVANNGQGKRSAIRGTNGLLALAIEALELSPITSMSRDEIHQILVAHLDAAIMAEARRYVRRPEAVAA